MRLGSWPAKACLSASTGSFVGRAVARVTASMYRIRITAPRTRDPHRAIVIVKAGDVVRSLNGLVIASCLLGAACSGHEQPTSPQPVRPPAIAVTDTPAARADKLARYIEVRWPRILVRDIDVDLGGTTVAYRVSADYDTSIPDRDAFAEHVARLAGDHRQASVELLKLTARHFPNLRYASVWQDSFLQAFWSCEQILELGPASSFRDFDRYTQLVQEAEISPPLLTLARDSSGSP